MNQFELESFFGSRGLTPAEKTALLQKLAADPAVETIDYKGIQTYRLK